MLPPACPTCDRLVDQPGQLCAACFGKTRFLAPPLCTRCGVPFEAAAKGGLDLLCTGCREDPPPWRQARGALRYDDQARRLILPFKHGDRLELRDMLARHMARAGAALLQRADLIVPVPLHRRRLLARRYNQAALLAQALSRISARPAVLDALRRTRPTPPLGGMGAAPRAAALAGAFAMRQRRRDLVADARVLLVDDVMTSGATAAACAKVLLGAGALDVDVLVAARVPDPRAD